MNKRQEQQIVDYYSTTDRYIRSDCYSDSNQTVFTRDKAVMRKLDTLVADFPATYKLMKQDEVSKTYSFPKSFVSYRKPRAVSTEQRERARQMMIELNKASGV